MGIPSAKKNLLSHLSWLRRRIIPAAVDLNCLVAQCTIGIQGRVPYFRFVAMLCQNGNVGRELGEKLFRSLQV